MGLLDGSTQQSYYEGASFGGYQFISINDIINNFVFAYVGEDKLIPSISKQNIQFHALRSLQELSYDTFKSIKSMEIDLPPSLQMLLPQDYVNYTSLTFLSKDGLERTIYPTRKTSNPFPPLQDTNNDLVFNQVGGLISSDNLIANGDFDDDDGWTITNTSGTAWVIGNYSHIDAGGSGIHHTYNNVLQGVATAVGYIEITAPDIIEGKKYKITYDIVIGSTAGQLILANHTTTQSTLNSGLDDDNVDLINEKVIGTHSVEWIQGPSNTGKIKLWSDAPFDGVIDNIKVTRVGGSENSDTWGKHKAANYSDPDVTNYVDGNSVYPTYYIDNNIGKIHFSSNMTGKTITLKYISDSLGTDGEMIVHKFAEEAMYKSIAAGIFSTRSGIPEYVVARFKREKFSATRTAKLRMSNLKINEMIDAIRGKGKHLKG